MTDVQRRIALIVNPVAGIGGAAGFKGSDGVDVQFAAVARGYQSRATDRASEALRQLPPGTPVLTASGAMGEAAVIAAGCIPEVVYSSAEVTTANDTIAAARAAIAAGADLVLFTGGDGTARDVLAGMPQSEPIPMLGVPAGVKMYSACFAVSPVAAGRLADAWLQTQRLACEEREVLDISEEQVRQGLVDATLYGLAWVPVMRGRTQARKTATPAGEVDAVASAAAGVVAAMQAGHNYILGPGGTTRAVARALGLDKTPLGVDVVRDGGLVAVDCGESDLLRLAAEHPSHAVVTVIGGQGFVLGRGNQQISASVVRLLATPAITVVATQTKLMALSGPLLFDTGDPILDESLAGHIRVITGIQDSAVVRAVAASADAVQGGAA